jgi:hypothetical protein
MPSVAIKKVKPVRMKALKNCFVFEDETPSYAARIAVIDSWESSPVESVE